MNNDDSDSDSGSDDDSEDEDEDEDDDNLDKDDKVPQGEDDSDEEVEDEGRKAIANKKAAAVASVWWAPTVMRVPSQAPAIEVSSRQPRSRARRRRTGTVRRDVELVGMPTPPPKSAPPAVMPAVRPGITVGTPTIKHRSSGPQ